MRDASSLWWMTSSYSKTSVFVRPHVNEKPTISKISPLGPFLKTCVCQCPNMAFTCGKKAKKKKTSPFKIMESLSLNAYGRWQTSYSSWDFFKIKISRLKQFKTFFMDNKLRETTKLCVEITNRKRQVKGKLGHVVQIRVCRNQNQIRRVNSTVI